MARAATDAVVSAEKHVLAPTKAVPPLPFIKDVPKQVGAAAGARNRPDQTSLRQPLLLQGLVLDCASGGPGVKFGQYKVLGVGIPLLNYVLLPGTSSACFLQCNALPTARVGYCPYYHRV